MADHKPPCPGPDAHVTKTGKPSCTSHRSPRQPEGLAGQPCRQPPIPGGTVCRYHGGQASQVKAAAEQRVEHAEAKKLVTAALADAYGENVPLIDMGEAMLRAISWKYAEVVALRSMVAQLDDTDRVWGVTRIKEGGDDQGTTREAKPNIWWTMLHAAEDQLVKYVTAGHAMKLGERRMRLAERDGALVADVIRGILTDLHLTPEQQQLVGTVVPNRLRQLAAAPEGAPR